MLLTGKLLLAFADGTIKLVSSAKEARESANGQKAIGYALSVAMTFGHNKAETPKEETLTEVKEEVKKDDSLPVKTAKKKAK
jgi:rRNA maturation endonuclease Nob1